MRLHQIPTRRSFLRQTGAAAIASALVGLPIATGKKRIALDVAKVEYQLYRNATARLHYAGMTFLLDPMLSAKGELPSFAGIAPNPTVELPAPVHDIVADIDAVIVSHLHEDHFDDAAAKILSKDIPLITPRNRAPISPRDPAKTVSHSQRLKDYGFTDVREIDDEDSNSTTFRGVTLTQTWALHGEGKVGELMGGVNGIVLSAPGMPTIYWAGDTILDVVEMDHILSLYKPDIVIAHTGGPVVEALSPEILLMDAAQGAELVEMVSRYNKNAFVIAVHMEALDHCFSSRKDFMAAVAKVDSDIQRRVFAPADGDVINFDWPPA
ncbi:MBL fold metallo-hydrolase [Erythrobacter rubeus]|uniref:MBL fold metallo-hydrolase n=1 Tax=Erythrobacter rubeus TaxID=2760803 RepID=A0ABR8KV78_9SPHN|nr:MBL fold metallo-hydrolase [Erythrobacter rubeus]MBD2842141.1 MBL fold metallo-hydrolase [Erythrobacter rubeus]